MQRGMFLVLEGGEGVGKTTQWSLLADLLRVHGHNVVQLREPGGTPVGDELRRILLEAKSKLAAETEALLFAASRAQIVRDCIVPALKTNSIVLVDRFLLSTYAYQGAGRQLAESSLREINSFATGRVAPDLTFLLSLPTSEALARVGARGAADRMEQESIDFHNRVAAEFITAASAEWQRSHPEIGAVELIDASGDAKTVLARIVRTLNSYWPERFASLQSSTIDDLSRTHV